jgi:hypothetical protein
MFNDGQFYPNNHKKTCSLEKKILEKKKYFRKEIYLKKEINFLV